jgi:protein-S-isoprenylcysteine O-methyltransferase Ste14
VRRWLEAPHTAATFAVCALHGIVAVLFALRRPAEGTFAMGDAARALPSMLAGAAALGLAAKVPAWPLAATVALALGAGLAAISLASLGRSFAVLPARAGARPLVTRGPYALVRHPAYLGELVMIGGALAAAGTWLAAGVGVLAIASFAVRVRAEERRLAEGEAYRGYMRAVRWRWVPGVW